MMGRKFLSDREIRNACRILMVKYTKRPLGRPKRRWVMINGRTSLNECMYWVLFNNSISVGNEIKMRKNMEQSG
jgi:hypothetical protein